MDEHSSMMASGDKLHIWTDGDNNKFLYVIDYINHNYPQYKIILCQPNMGNKYKWDAFVEIEWDAGNELAKELKSEFF